ncbi:hypothetical protein EXIGLDRAFT_218945 [Exidia glandulosa HHB12029]|uniref:Uncharacterized protein n=1 Tax=Exidia glandulosa HHB12029 TaxID=1314781 RepID=A0A165ED40_EXIGL|nr:hypothetical protein EXIGLDRAFT_218945 [Exidia glandulosa HHB12029]
MIGERNNQAGGRKRCDIDSEEHDSKAVDGGRSKRKHDGKVATRLQVDPSARAPKLATEWVAFGLQRPRPKRCMSDTTGRGGGGEKSSNSESSIASSASNSMSRSSTCRSAKLLEIFFVEGAGADVKLDEIFFTGAGKDDLGTANRGLLVLVVVVFSLSARRRGSRTGTARAYFARQPIATCFCLSRIIISSSSSSISFACSSTSIPTTSTRTFSCVWSGVIASSSSSSSPLSSANNVRKSGDGLAGRSTRRARAFSDDTARRFLEIGGLDKTSPSLGARAGDESSSACPGEGEGESARGEIYPSSCSTGSSIISSSIRARFECRGPLSSSAVGVGQDWDRVAAKSELVVT